jgi:hypothetical protein
MPQPSEFLSIFYIDPRIFQQVNDVEKIEHLRHCWVEMGRRILAADSPIQSTTSDIGALIVNLKTKDGKEWYRDFVSKMNCSDLEVDAILCGIQNRLVHLQSEYEVEDIYNLTEEEKQDLCKNHGVAGFLELDSFEKGDFIRQPWWAQFASRYQPVDVHVRIRELKNILLYSDDIRIFDRYWEPDNNPSDNNPSSKNYNDLGYEYTFEMFEFIRNHRTLPPSNIEIHTSEKKFWLKPSFFSRTQNKTIPAKLARHKLNTYKEIHVGSKKVCSYDLFYNRAMAALKSIKVKIHTWAEKKFKMRALICEFGGVSGDYGPNQHLTTKKDMVKILPVSGNEDVKNDFMNQSDLKRVRLV